MENGIVGLQIAAVGQADLGEALRLGVGVYRLTYGSDVCNEMRHPIVVDTHNALVDRRPDGNQLTLFTMGAMH